MHRTTAEDPAFFELIAELDAELRARYGAVQDTFDGYNGLAGVTTAMLLSDTSGWVACGAFRAVDDACAELKRMYVRPDRRGRGFASEIIGGLEAWARELGFTSMILETGDQQPEAIALYQKRGYAIIDCYGPYANIATSICMRKTL